MKKLILIICFLPTIPIAQELNCRVDVNYENLPIENRELLFDFANVVEKYMNSTRFTKEDRDDSKIDCSLNIFFTSSKGKVNYSAQVVIVSHRAMDKSRRNSPILVINDDKWSFVYEEKQALYSGQNTYESITSFLEFYALLIIGFDMDTWEEFGGTTYFRRAQDIANLGAKSKYSTR